MDAKEIIICRCEEITLAEVLAAIDDGCHTITSIKKATRAGMGACQGRTCNRLIMQILLSKGLQTSATIAVDKARFPIIPCTIAALGEDN
ncbi:MAG: (2Fe-2S)-binding protein [Clostridia bacterium]